MIRRAGFTILVFAALVAGCAAQQSHAGPAGESRSELPTATAPAHVARLWEYAVLCDGGSGTFQFLSGASFLDNGSPGDFDKFYRAVGGSEAPPAAGNRTAVLLDLLGRQGWELVAVTSDDRLQFGRWYFKRPRD